jgi:hypothetical protein
MTIRLPIESDLAPDRIERLSDLINEVYDDAESGMWKRPGTRTNPRDLKCHSMRLELLAPRGWNHPSKEFLKQWYSRIGYKPETTEPLEMLHPELVPELATLCDYTVWYKSLA